MGKLWKKIPLMIRIRIVFGALIASIIVVGLDIANIATLVSRNYLVSSASSPALSRSAFIYNYSVRTGDNTLALLTGTDISVRPIGGVSYGIYTNEDLRNLAKAIGIAFVEQGRDSGYTEEERQEVIAIYNSSHAEGSKWESLENIGLYNNKAEQEYAINGAKGIRTLTLNRCCCCFSEGMAQMLLDVSWSPSESAHTRGMGLKVKPPSTYRAMPTGTADGVVQVDGRYVQDPLSSIWVSGSVPKLEEMVNNGMLSVGSVVLYTSNKEGTSSNHVDMITYIDKATKTIYLAGAGSDNSILKCALWGYDKKVTYGSGETLQAFENCYKNKDGVTDHFVVNVVHYTECYNVTGGK